MSDTLWNDIDTYVEAAIEMDMGSGSGVATLALARIEQGDTFDPDKVTYPFCLIVSDNGSYGEAEAMHGDSEWHMEGVAYNYEIVFAVTNTTAALAKADVKTLLGRPRETQRCRPPGQRPKRRV